MRHLYTDRMLVKVGGTKDFFNQTGAGAQIGPFACRVESAEELVLTPGGEEVKADSRVYTDEVQKLDDLLSFDGGSTWNRIVSAVKAKGHGGGIHHCEYLTIKA